VRVTAVTFRIRHLTPKLMANPQTDFRSRVSIVAIEQCWILHISMEPFMWLPAFQSP